MADNFFDTFIEGDKSEKTIIEHKKLLKGQLISNIWLWMNWFPTKAFSCWQNSFYERIGLKNLIMSVAWGIYHLIRLVTLPYAKFYDYTLWTYHKRTCMWYLLVHHLFLISFGVLKACRRCVPYNFVAPFENHVQLYAIWFVCRMLLICIIIIFDDNTGFVQCSDDKDASLLQTYYYSTELLHKS